MEDTINLIGNKIDLDKFAYIFENITSSGLEAAGTGHRDKAVRKINLLIKMENMFNHNYNAEAYEACMDFRINALNSWIEDI
ncbi:hypothetical protein DY102_07270 [Apilactobacillus timberlakei]|uniref:hypothetical protein n=1 Tax=Apilactobacillus timberlakei TaxID=2008380 RepID=UPI001128CF54|nr:hypothetical protein [Apilactobacillus timberlakei]TPR21484.1 hypothetical protein DY102_07270 [Apilactobacillus timberlakei]